MMNRFILLSFLIICLNSCGSGNNTYQIEGLLPNSTYDGEYVYLVPLKGATAANVDSSIVVGGGFRLKGKVEEPQIRILRMRPGLRLRFQELLVVVEPGLIEAKIDSISSAKGTPENDILQEWKEQIMHFNEERTQMIRHVQETDTTDVNGLKLQLQQLDRDCWEYNREFVKKHPGSVVSTFIQDMKK